MSNWRVERHYGFGAARIPIQAEFHRGTEAHLRDGLGTVFSELVEGGPAAALRRVAGQTPAIVLGLLLMMAFVVTLTKDHSDYSPIEMVLLETLEPILAPPIPQEPLELKEPEIPIAELAPEPPKPMPLPERVAPKPAPPPPQLAERPPPPPSIAKPRPRPRPAPVMPRIAKIEVPKPPPEARPVRTKRERSQPNDRPRVAIAPLKTKMPVAPLAPERLARATAPRPNAPRNTPKPAAPAAPRFDSEPTTAPRPTFRVVVSRPMVGDRAKVLPGLAPAPRQPAAPTSAPAPRQNRASAPRLNPSRSQRPPTPALAPVTAPTTKPQARAAATRLTRESPRTPQRAVRRPAAEVARTSSRPSATPTKLASRASRTAPATSTGPSGRRPGVSGVPLGDLAACVTDREEDRLKQAVVAAVKTQKECVSGKGTYQFIETKNLNAFLMWIERPPSRVVEDRCAELHYALECLHSASQRAAR
jgi:hypothetical protein